MDRLLIDSPDTDKLSIGGTELPVQILIPFPTLLKYRIDELDLTQCGSFCLFD